MRRGYILQSGWKRTLEARSHNTRRQGSPASPTQSSPSVVQSRSPDAHPERSVAAAVTAAPAAAARCRFLVGSGGGDAARRLEQSLHLPPLQFLSIAASCSQPALLLPGRGRPVAAALAKANIVALRDSHLLGQLRGQMVQGTESMAHFDCYYVAQQSIYWLAGRRLGVAKGRIRTDRCWDCHRGRSSSGSSFLRRGAAVFSAATGAAQPEARRRHARR